MGLFPWLFFCALRKRIWPLSLVLQRVVVTMTHARFPYFHIHTRSVLAFTKRVTVVVVRRKKRLKVLLSTSQTIFQHSTMPGIDECEPYDYEDNSTVNRPASPDSVCTPPSLRKTIGKGPSTVGTTVTSASVSQSADTNGSVSVAKSANTNGSDSTWKPSSLLGSDGVPWWEDKEGSHIPSYSNQDDSESTNEDATIDNSVQSATIETEKTAPAEELHSSLVLLMEAVRTGEFPPTPQNLSQSEPSLGDLNISVDISECESSITGEHEMPGNGRKNENRNPQESFCYHAKGRQQLNGPNYGGGVRQNKVYPAIEPSESCHSSSGSERNATRPQRRSSTGIPKSRENGTTERRHSCSGTHAVASSESENYGHFQRLSSSHGESHEDGLVDDGRYQHASISYGEQHRERRLKRRPSPCDNYDDDRHYQRQSSSYGEHDHAGRYQHRSNSHGDRVGRAERRSSDARRRRSLSNGRLISSSTSRSRSSRDLHHESDYIDSNGDDVRRTKSGQYERRNSTTGRRRSVSIGRLDSGSKSRSSRRLHDGAGSGDDDGPRSHRTRSGRRHERLESSSSRRRQSSSRRLSDDHDDRYEPRRRGSGGHLNHDRRQRSSNDISRHRHGRSSHRRDLGSSSHHGSRNDESFRRSSRRSSSRHSRGDHHRHRARSRTTRTRRDSDEEEEPESKAAVKSFIMGLLKNPHPPSSHHRRTGSTSHQRRQSFSGLDDRRSRHRTTSRRQSGKHI